MDEKLNNDQAAAYIGVSGRTLHNWRCQKKQKIPYFKIGGKVIYRKSVLDTWLASREVKA